MMTDTKHELPEIDWAKPVEAFVDDEWCEVTSALRNNDGSLYVNKYGDVYVVGPILYNEIKPHNIRNKPEPLELWVNIYPGMVNMVAHPTEDQADSCAESHRIRRARMVEAPDQ
jgi:hypothetical protein